MSTKKFCDCCGKVTEQGVFRGGIKTKAPHKLFYPEHLRPPEKYNPYTYSDEGVNTSFLDLCVDCTKNKAKRISPLIDIIFDIWEEKKIGEEDNDSVKV